MLDHLFEQLGKLVERASNDRRDTYLASSTDLADLDRRMRVLDGEGLYGSQHHAYGPYTGAPYDRNHV